MKRVKSKFLVLLVIGAVVVLSACRKDEAKIEKWIVGTWSLDKQTQETYSDNELQGESESTDLGKIEFRKDGTGTDVGGNFIGSDFEWENTDKELILTEGAGNVTTYDIDEFSKKKFEFSKTVTSGSEKEINRWFLSK